MFICFPPVFLILSQPPHNYKPFSPVYDTQVAAEGFLWYVTGRKEVADMNSYVTGPAIKQLREQRNLTQGALAEKIGVSSKTVSKWETGKGLPDISLLQPLAQALGISLIELMNG
jgi:DNA-binding XRE family transcriptional regulator